VKGLPEQEKAKKDLLQYLDMLKNAVTESDVSDFSLNVINVITEVIDGKSKNIWPRPIDSKHDGTQLITLKVLLNHGVKPYGQAITIKGFEEMHGVKK